MTLEPSREKEKRVLSEWIHLLLGCLIGGLQQYAANLTNFYILSYFMLVFF